MKRIALILTIFVSALCFAASSFAEWSITKSRHNFSTSNIANTTHTSGTEKVCVFCHTPHGSRLNGDGAIAPLWNRRLGTDNSGQIYSMYNSPTLDSRDAYDRGVPDGVSLACLSCHDGTVALDAFVNAPGSGKWTATGKSQGWTFAATGDTTYGAGFTARSGNTMSKLAGGKESGFVPFLSTDLRNDHPISMRYAGRIVGTTTATSLDPKFRDATVLNDSLAVVGPRSVALTGGSVTDGDIRLFNAPGKGLAAEYKVQCASCHNPHGTIDGSVADRNTPYPTFLQKNNVASNVCTTCHIK